MCVGEFRRRKNGCIYVSLIQNVHSWWWVRKWWWASMSEWGDTVCGCFTYAEMRVKNPFRISINDRTFSGRHHHHQNRNNQNVDWLTPYSHIGHQILSLSSYLAVCQSACLPISLHYIYGTHNNPLYKRNGKHASFRCCYRVVSESPFFIYQPNGVWPTEAEPGEVGGWLFRQKSKLFII